MLYKEFAESAWDREEDWEENIENKMSKKGANGTFGYSTLKLVLGTVRVWEMTNLKGWLSFTHRPSSLLRRKYPSPPLKGKINKTQPPSSVSSCPMLSSLMSRRPIYWASRCLNMQMVCYPEACVLVIDFS